MLPLYFIKIPRVLRKFPNFLCFPYRELFWTFSLFSLRSGDPEWLYDEYLLSLDLTQLGTNYREGGGLQNGRGGACEVLPLRKGGAEKCVAMLKGGGAQSVLG